MVNETSITIVQQAVFPVTVIIIIVITLTLVNGHLLHSIFKYTILLNVIVLNINYMATECLHMSCVLRLSSCTFCCVWQHTALQLTMPSQFDLAYSEPLAVVNVYASVPV